MEITGEELAQRTGLSISTIRNYARNGIIPKIENSSGQVRFDEERVLAAISEKGIRPKPRRTVSEIPPETAPASVEQDEREEVEGVGANPVSAIVLEAFRKSRAAFRREIRRQIQDAASQGNEVLELALLRVYVHCGEAFTAVQNEILSDDNAESESA